MNFWPFSLKKNKNNYIEKSQLENKKVQKHDDQVKSIDQDKQNEQYSVEGLHEQVIPQLYVNEITLKEQEKTNTDTEYTMEKVVNQGDKLDIIVKKLIEVFEKKIKI
jgi:hypothetical protein